MVAGEKEAARPAGVNETQSCRRAEPEETHCCLPYGTVQDLDQLVRRIQGATRTSWILLLCFGLHALRTNTVLSADAQRRAGAFSHMRVAGPWTLCLASRVALLHC